MDDVKRLGATEAQPVRPDRGLARKGKFSTRAPRSGCSRLTRLPTVA